MIVHGGGREVDTELARHGIEKRAVDGLRITDDATLGVVVAVLAGRVNTRLVAAAARAGARAVGLTGADATMGLVEPAPPYETADGRRVELGFVGRPIGNGRPQLLIELCARGYVPVVASIGIDEEGRLFNVNADTLAVSPGGQAWRWLARRGGHNPWRARPGWADDPTTRSPDARHAHRRRRSQRGHDRQACRLP